MNAILSLFSLLRALPMTVARQQYVELLIASALGILIAVAATAQEQIAPSIHFTARGATITGVTPNANAAVFGIGVQADGYFPVRFRWSGVADCDNKGQAMIDFGVDVPPSTIWAIVDGRTGQASLVTPSGTPVLVAALPATAQLSVAYEKSLTISGASPAADIAAYGVIHRHVEGREIKEAYR